MLLRTIQFLMLLHTGISVVALAAGPDFREGEWDVSYQMEVVGAPISMPPITVRKTMCLDQNNYVPDNSQPGQNCRISDRAVNGNTVTWTMNCNAQDKVIEGQGRITYHGSRYDGAMSAALLSLSMETAGAAVSYRYSMHGQRTGDCHR